MTSPADLAQNYFAGLKVPTSSEAGLPAIVDDTGFNLRYGRSATPVARQESGALYSVSGVTQLDSFDLVPYQVRLSTLTDATVQAGPVVAVPEGYKVEAHVTLTGRTAAGVSVKHLYTVAVNLDGTITCTDLQEHATAAWDTQSLFTGAFAFVSVVTAAGFKHNLTRKAATDTNWTVEVKVSAVRINGE